MGNSLDKVDGYADEDSRSSNENSDSKSPKIRKRKSENEIKPSPVKVTKLDTAKYVYERLFLQGENSDVRVHALDQCWNLHILYLQQCDYFQAMFDGSWKDSVDRDVYIEVPDDNVTVEGLRAVFGSLYYNEIKYSVDEIEGVIAAASLFQLNAVLDRCAEDLVNELNDTNVVRFLNVSKRYGLTKLLNEAMSYLQKYFWRIVKNRNILCAIEEDTFENIVTNPQLLVVEGEMDLYQTVKNWVAVRSDPGLLTEPDAEFPAAVTRFLASLPSGRLFSAYSAIFASLRFHHLVTTTGSILEVEKDNLIPKEILRAVMVDQWKFLLTNEENPMASATISDEDFWLNCIRLGRVVESSPVINSCSLNSPGQKCWRWTGYNYGVDVILNYNRGLLTMKRNCLHQATPYSVNLKSERTIHCRVVVFNSHGNLLHDSGKHVVTMRLDQSIVVCRFAEDALPISVHFCYLAAQPAPPSLLYVNQYVRSHIPQPEKALLNVT